MCCPVLPKGDEPDSPEQKTSGMTLRRLPYDTIRRKQMLRQAELAGAFHIGRMSLLSVNDIPVLVLVFVESLLIGSHGAEAHAHIREATVVEKILHGHLAGEV